MRIYLMGSITGWFRIGKLEEAIKWRRWFTKELSKYNIKTFDPTINFQINLKFPGNSIVAQNNIYLTKCDIGILNTEMILQSPGTIYEITTYKLQNKPVLAFGEKVNQPHIDYCITDYFNTKEELLDHIIAMYGQLL